MKILHVTAIGSEVKKSGVPSVLLNLSAEQNNIEGVQSKVLSVRTEKGKEEDCFDTLRTVSIIDYLKKYNPDLVIIHTIFFLQYVKVVRALCKLNIPFAIEPHGSFGKMALHKSHLKKVLALHTLFRPFIHKSAAFIYTNQAEKQDSIIHKDLELVIPNGVSEANISFTPQEHLLSYPIPVFYYLGRYKIHHKGLDYLMKALKILNDQRESICVRFYGMGDNDEMDFMNKWISVFDFIDVKEMGTLYGEEKKNVLSRPYVLLLTSRYEGSPITVLDALTYGNPCLVTPGTNVADEIEQNKIGWKTDLDPKCIAECILRAKADYIKDKDGYGDRCKRYVTDNYLWSKIADFSIKEYRKIISK